MPGAVVFDVMGTLFSLGPLRERLRAVGAPELAFEAWFGRLLHSATSLTLAGEFRPFPEIAEAALRTALAQQGIDEDVAPNVLERLAELAPYEDAEAALADARSAGLAIATLTNGTESNTRTLLEGAGLDKYVEAVITVEEVRAYKPAPEPYRHAAKRLGVEPGDAYLVAAHGWDVLGAANAGLSAVWVDRLERRWPFPLPEPRRAPGLVEAVALVIGSQATRPEKGAGRRDAARCARTRPPRRRRRHGGDDGLAGAARPTPFARLDDERGRAAERGEPLVGRRPRTGAGREALARGTCA